MSIPASPSLGKKGTQSRRRFGLRPAAAHVGEGFLVIRLGEVSSPQQRGPEVVVSLGIAGIQFQHLLPLHDGRRQLAPGPPGPPPSRKAGTTRPRARRSSSSRPGGYSQTPEYSPRGWR